MEVVVTLFLSQLVTNVFCQESDSPGSKRDPQFLLAVFRGCCESQGAWWPSVPPTVVPAQASPETPPGLQDLLCWGKCLGYHSWLGFT